MPLPTNNPTLLDIANRMDPDGTLPVIAEMMNKVNPILGDMPMIEGNLQTGHQGTIRSGIPAVAWRILNYGTLPTKSSTKQVVDTCGIMEAYSEIDKVLFELNGAKDSFRMSEDQAHVEAMAQELANTFFYGNTQTDPEKFLGITYRYNDLAAENAIQLIDAGNAQADLSTSIWLMSWDRRIVHGIYPKGTKGGLEHEDLGEVTSQNQETAGGPARLMQVLRSHFMQRVGLHLKDWQGVVRIHDIEMTLGVVQDDVIPLMVRAYYKIPLRLRATGRMVFYMNPSCKEKLVTEAMENADAKMNAGNTVTIQQLEDGEPMVRFWGIPVRECDAILNTEAIVA